MKGQCSYCCDNDEGWLCCGLKEGHDGEHKDCYGYSRGRWYVPAEVRLGRKVDELKQLLAEARPFVDTACVTAGSVAVGRERRDLRDRIDAALEDS